jgi:hypothetical protein
MKDYERISELYDGMISIRSFAESVQRIQPTGPAIVKIKIAVGPTVDSYIVLESEIDRDTAVAMSALVKAHVANELEKSQ